MPKSKISAEFKKEWIKADLSDLNSVKIIANAIGKVPLDVFIYNAGIWETKGYEKTTQNEIVDIINVNLTSVILIIQKLLKNIRKGFSKKIIFIGSTCGLENEGSDSIIYTATKFGLRGVTHSLRDYLRDDSISVSCISPGSIASDILFKEGSIPFSDIISIINVIINSSVATCIKEIHIPALKDTGV